MTAIPARSKSPLRAIWLAAVPALSTAGGREPRRGRGRGQRGEASRRWATMRRVIDERAAWRVDEERGSFRRPGLRSIDSTWASPIRHTL